MNLDYVIFDRKFSVDNANFAEPSSLEDVYADDGDSIAADMPENPPELIQKPDSGDELPDYIKTHYARLMSKPLADKILTLSEKVEAFPVILLNTQKMIISENYFLMNIFQTCDCIDRDASEFTVDPFRKAFFSTMACIAIDAARIDLAMNIFLLKPFPQILMIKKYIADELCAEFSGIKLKTIYDYNNELRKFW